MNYKKICAGATLVSLGYVLLVLNLKFSLEWYDLILVLLDFFVGIPVLINGARSSK
jgi:hypothetical protein